MTAATKSGVGCVVLCAPCAGRLRFVPPRALCGELEVYDAGQILATIDAGVIAAPASGFVVRVLAADGTNVAAGSDIVVYSIVSG